MCLTEQPVKAAYESRSRRCCWLPLPSRDWPGLFLKIPHLAEALWERLWQFFWLCAVRAAHCTHACCPCIPLFPLPLTAALLMALAPSTSVTARSMVHTLAQVAACTVALDTLVAYCLHGFDAHQTSSSMALIAWLGFQLL